MTMGLRTRLALDAFLTAALFASMAHSITGAFIHEVSGAVVLLVALAHNLINRRWYGTLIKFPLRRRDGATVAVNIALALAGVTVTASGVMMSRVVFPFLATDVDLPLREIHTVSAHWFLILASAHLGLHWKTVTTIAGKMIGGIKAPGRVGSTRAWAAWAVVVVYGAIAFVDMDVGQKLIGYYGFGFRDTEEFPGWFFARQAAIMGLVVFAVHHAPRILRTGWAIVSERHGPISPP